MAFVFEPLPRAPGSRPVNVWSDGKHLGIVEFARVPGRGRYSPFVYAWTLAGYGWRFKTREEAAEAALVEYLLAARTVGR